MKFEDIVEFNFKNGQKNYKEQKKQQLSDIFSNFKNVSEQTSASIQLKKLGAKTSTYSGFVISQDVIDEQVEELTKIEL